MATAEEVDFTRFRVVTEQGILAVFDADEDWDGRDEPLSQLAYWHDLASEQLFFFDQRLFTLDDVLQSIATMQRDLNIELADVLAERPDFAPLPEITTPGQWRPATEVEVVTVMAGGMTAAGSEGAVSGLINPCVPIDCGPMAMAMSGPLAAPVRGTPRDQLFAMASRGSNCSCTPGGGGCPNFCPDPNECIISSCQQGTCVDQPVNCNDGNLCTDDSCDPNEGCNFEWKDCPPPDPCTTGSCIESTGECTTESYCSGDRQCCEEFATVHCCPGDYTCCEYYWNPQDENGCCPPDRPFCCGNTSLNTDCCATEADCCNGVCRTGCQQACCNGVWQEGPCCGTSHCNAGQICCNGQCCGDSCNPGQCINNQCVTTPACEDGNECTEDPCTPENCGQVACNGHPAKADLTSCADDEDVCTVDYCFEGVCIHPAGEDGEPCAPDSDFCTLDQCLNGVCSHPPKCAEESTAHGIAADRICCPDGHCCLGDETCCGEGCCGAGDYCCSDLSGCCPNGFECCGNACCPAGACCHEGVCINHEGMCGKFEVCCHGTCCAENQFCCNMQCVTHDAYNFCCHDTEVCYEGECCNEDGTCTLGSPLADCQALEACQKRKSNPNYDNTSNGCSSPAGDNPTGCADTSFTTACDQHDYCYGTCNANKGACDSAFHFAMLQICIVSSCPQSCIDNADDYYLGVQILGGPAYCAAQAQACLCCDP